MIDVLDVSCEVIDWRTGESISHNFERPARGATPRHIGMASEELFLSFYFCRCLFDHQFLKESNQYLMYLISFDFVAASTAA